MAHGAIAPERAERKYFTKKTKKTRNSKTKNNKKRLMSHKTKKENVKSSGVGSPRSQ